MYEILSHKLFLIHLIQSLIGMFLSIALLQSSVDKLFDRKGNLEWLSDHFTNTILGNYVPVLLLFITVIEVLSGVVLFLGSLVNILISNSNLLAIGFLLSSFNFISLFLGQRIAKDYAGAAVIVNYFILNILGLISLLFIFY